MPVVKTNLRQLRLIMILQGKLLDTYHLRHQDATAMHNQLQTHSKVPSPGKMDKAASHGQRGPGCCR
jgi:hypothetical protein